MAYSIRHRKTPITSSVENNFKVCMYIHMYFIISLHRNTGQRVSHRRVRLTVVFDSLSYALITGSLLKKCLDLGMQHMYVRVCTYVYIF